MSLPSGLKCSDIGCAPVCCVAPSGVRLPSILDTEQSAAVSVNASATPMALPTGLNATEPPVQALESGSFVKAPPRDLENIEIEIQLLATATNGPDGLKVIDREDACTGTVGPNGVNTEVACASEQIELAPTAAKINAMNARNPTRLALATDRPP